MFPLKTILYLVLFAIAFFASILKHPVIGVYAYLVTYNINPLGQWWGRFLPGLASRYAMLLTLAIGLGILFQRAKLRYDRFWELQELWFILLVGIMWLSVIIGHGSGIHYNIEKMTKVLLVLLMASHVVTTTKHFEGMIWVFILSGFYLGYELYGGAGAFRGGRFHAGVGGSDFGEGNFLAAHFGFVLPFVGAMILKGNWKVRALCILVSVFMVNAIILTNSRGIFIALLAAVVMAPLFAANLKKYRRKIFVLLIIGILGAMQLTHEGFWDRMSTIQAEEEDRDRSAKSRLEAWDGALLMAKDYPLGVGVGQFINYIGVYYPELTGRDTHNTYLRCLAELGVQGFLVMVLMTVTAFIMLRNIDRRAVDLPPEIARNFYLYSFATKLSLVVYMTAAIFISSVYIEEFYWLLLFPVFLKRVLDNEFIDARIREEIRQAMVPS